MKHHEILWKRPLCTGLILAVFVLGRAETARGGILSSIGDGISNAGNYVWTGVKKKTGEASDAITDSAAGRFVRPAERNKRDRERVLSVLAAEGAIVRKPDGTIRIVDQSILDKNFESLRSNGALDKVYGYGRKDPPDAPKYGSGQFWKNFFDGKDYNRGDLPESMDPFANNSRGLATKMHTQLSTATDEASSTYNTYAGDLGLRGVDVMDKELRIGVAAGADTYIKAMDALTAGNSTKAVEWAEEAAEMARKNGEDPQKAVSDYVKGKIREEIGNKMSEGLKKALGEDKYDDLMEKYDSYGSEQEKLKKLMSDMYKTTGDERFKKAGEKLDGISADALAQKVTDKLPMPDILKTSEELEEEQKAKEEQAKADAALKAKEDALKEPEKETAPPEDEVKPGEEESPPADEVQPDAEDAPADEDVVPDAEDSTPDEEIVPDDETETGEEIEMADEADEVVPEDTSRDGRDRTPDAGEEVKPADEDEPEIEAEVETEAPPEAGEAKENPDGSTTITKGWVENADGRITITETTNPDGTTTTTTTETDRDGNIISQTTYGESGEGRTTRPDNDLRDGEAGSDADVDAETASSGVNTSGSYGDLWTDQQSQRGTESTTLMGDNSQMEESSNAGNDQIRQAKITRNQAGRDASAAMDAARRKTMKNDRENSWGKAIGDGVESGITEGGKAFGSAFGGGAADAAVGAIFGTSDEDTSGSSSGSGKVVSGAASAASGTAATSTSTASTKGKPQTKPKTKPKGKPNTSSSGGTDGQVLVSTENDIPLGGESLDVPSGGSSSSSGGVRGHCPKCGRTDLVEHVYETDNMIVHDWRCPVCNVSGVPGPPPAGLGDSSGSASSGDDTVSGGSGYDDEDDDSTQPCSGQPCGRCGYCPCRREPPDPGDDEDVICYFHCPKCGWRMPMIGN